MSANPFRFLKAGAQNTSFREWHFTDTRAPQILITVTHYEDQFGWQVRRHIYRKDTHHIPLVERWGREIIWRTEDILGHERDMLIAMAALRT